MANKRVVTLADWKRSGEHNDEENPRNSPVIQLRNARMSHSENGSVPNVASDSSFLSNVHHIPSLNNATEAKSLLLRVVREFQPILERRKYNVLSISELCCCNDGLDFARYKSGAKRKKLGKMANNVWGYNRISFGRKKSHTIHVRLRQPTNHSRFLPYEDVAGTLAHELAHCEHANHNANFYKLMEEILDEHATLMAGGLRKAGAPAYAFGGSGNVLGVFRGRNGDSIQPDKAFGGAGNVLGSASLPNSLRERKNGVRMEDSMGKGYKLGGDTTFTSWMSPAETAAVAAQARQRAQQLRLRGDHCCQPCIIDIPSDDEESDTTNGPRKRDRKKLQHTGSSQSRKHAQQERNIPTDIVDLTNSDKKSTSKPIPDTGVEWSCQECTYRNRPLALMCDMCASERKTTFGVR